MSQGTITLTELQRMIARRAWEDPAFEAEFMADPKGTFEKYLQQRLPEDLAIHAHYNSPDEVHFVVPGRPASSTDELTDEDLERVAGGELVWGTAVIGSAYVVLASIAAATIIGKTTGAWGK